MKKKISVLFLALALCLCLLPATASAVSVGSLPAQWTAPTNVTVTKEGESEFVLKVSYSVGADHSKFIDDTENLGNYSAYGLTDAVYPVSNIQVDWRIDGGAWHYDSLWDVGNEERSGADTYLYYRGEAPYGAERAGYTYILRLPMQEDYSSDYEGWKTEMTAQGAGDLSANSDGYMQLDLTKHKVEVRIRLITAVQGADVDAAYGEESAYHYILSPWSAVAAIGKGAEAVTKPTSIPKPAVSNFTVKKAVNDGTVDDGYPIFTFNLAVPAEISKIDATATALTATLGIRAQVNVNNGGWQDIRIGSADWAAVTDGLHTGYMPALTDGDIATVLGGSVQFRARYHWMGGDELYSGWSDTLTFGTEGWSSSEWATEELKKADALGLIPDVLKSADLKNDITRAEFAAVAVKVYEALSGTAAIPIVNNPFTDCKDVEVLKAYNIGAVNGTSATTFAPNDLLNREQAATMLTRVFKKITLSGWTLATDSQFTLPYTKPAAFADDNDISGYARDSVYFMVANEIIKGVGDNKFAPRNTTTAQSAQGYANATREQSLVIAVRMVENLK